VSDSPFLFQLAQVLSRCLDFLILGHQGGLPVWQDPSSSFSKGKSSTVPLLYLVAGRHSSCASW